MGIKLIVWWLKPLSFLIKMAVWMSQGQVGMFMQLKYAASLICVQVKTSGIFMGPHRTAINASVITSVIFFHVAD